MGEDTRGNGGQVERFESGPRRDRRHQHPARSRRVYLRLSTEEHTGLVAAAARLGMSTAGFCTEAALGAVATGQIQGAEAAREQLRELMGELFAARIAVNRFGTNVNQAVAELHSCGTSPVWLAEAVGLCGRAVGRVDAVCEQICRLLPVVRGRVWRR
jgi:uncharacterized protein (DUF1778 family)